ncbi:MULTISPECIES: sugar porter family MFS transporter [unclassified Streptomyces]|uniref:sugar porter family MFS transporter n=1 Tax=unclassified Streptomyces TaxID=2593676 RepID=UPI002156233D|nr:MULTISPECIES: sugar porter family MFS transporter [unclassified Streptomyces]
MYPLRIRPAATGLHAAALWGSNLLVTSTALTLVGTLTLGGAMLVYATLNVIAWIVVFFRVPETKGRSLEAVEQSLKHGTFLPEPARRRS